MFSKSEKLYSTYLLLKVDSLFFKYVLFKEKLEDVRNFVKCKYKNYRKFLAQNGLTKKASINRNYYMGGQIVSQKKD